MPRQYEHMTQTFVGYARPATDDDLQARFPMWLVVLKEEALPGRTGQEG